MDADRDGLADARELLARRQLVDAQEGGLRSSLNLSLSLSVSDRRLAPTGAATAAAAATAPTVEAGAEAEAAAGEGEQHGAGAGAGRRRPPSLKEVKLPKAVFRGRSDGTRAPPSTASMQDEDEDEDDDDEGSVGDGEGAAAGDGWDGWDGDDLAGLVGAASRVRVHRRVLQYAREMREEGVLEDVLAFVRADPRCRVVVTGWVIGWLGGVDGGPGAGAH